MRSVTSLAALVPVGIYLSVAFRRIGYPYELEWLEGGAVEIVHRAAQGHSIYVAPSIHFVPYPYTPLYFWVSAAVSQVTGVGFFPLRLVSVLSSIGCFWLLYHLVRRETGDRVAGVVAAGIFAATYQLSQAWLDIGRVDSMALLLVLATLVVARKALDLGPAGAHRSRPAMRWWGSDTALGIGLGLVAFAAFFTKQSAAFVTLPALGVVAMRRHRVGLLALAACGVAIAVSTVILDALTDGWYRYYVFEELRHQGVVHSVWFTFLPHDLFHPLAGVVTVGLCGLALGVWARRTTWPWFFWAVAIATLIASSWVARLHSGGSRNVLIPAFAGLALLIGLGFAEMSAHAPEVALRVARYFRAGEAAGLAVARSTAVVVALGLTAVLVGQLAALRYPVARDVPDRADVQAGRHLIELIASRPGDVIVWNHPWYETMAGKPAFAQGEAVHDIIRAGPSRARTLLRRSIATTIAESKVSTILLDTDGGKLLDPELDRSFRLGPPVFSCQRCLFPVTDLAVRPDLLYERIAGGVVTSGRDGRTSDR